MVLAEPKQVIFGKLKVILDKMNYRKEVKVSKRLIYRLKDGINEAMMNVRDGYNELAYSELEQLLDVLNKELESVE